MRIFLSGSLRNPQVPILGNRLRAAGHDVFDDWYGSGPEADERWQQYEELRGRPYREALYADEPMRVFNLDYQRMNWAEVGVLLLPASRSAHLETGYMIGRGKEVYVVFDREPERFDIMYALATRLCFSHDELVEALRCS